MGYPLINTGLKRFFAVQKMETLKVHGMPFQHLSKRNKVS